MHFSWTGLILAPLPVPLIASAALAPLLNGDGPVVLPFLILLIPACMVSYGTTAFLFLPALFLLSAWRQVTGWMACALGFVLGLAVIVPVTLPRDCAERGRGRNPSAHTTLSRPRVAPSRGRKRIMVASASSGGPRRGDRPGEWTRRVPQRPGHLSVARRKSTARTLG